MTMNWTEPNYRDIFAQRGERLIALRKDAGLLRDVKHYYATHPADFINDWGVTIDPRVKAKGRSPIMPFILFPKQRQLIDWMYDCWKNGDPGLIEKSRDVGASWLAMGFSCSMCMFNTGMAIGFGSAKEDKVDRIGDPDTLFYKGRLFMSYLPREFTGEFDVRKHSPFMRILFPWMESGITGEAGDNIGRGGRKAVYILDESAHIERPKLIDASLTANTDCRIDMSSVKGTANSFAERRHSGNIKVFTFHYRDDPRKTDEWIAKKKSETDAITWAQEYEISYSASVEGIVIPAVWVSAAIDAHKKLGIEPTGIRDSALDVADRGIDKNAWGYRHGILLKHAESWSGSTDTQDIYETTERAFNLCDRFGLKSFDYDADGLGAGVRGDARKINQDRMKDNDRRIPSSIIPLITVSAFRGSGELFDPEKIVPKTDRKAKDFFENYKAQCWWALRFRFEETYNALQGKPYDKSAIISIASDFPERARLCIELSQPVYLQSKAGKMLIDKTPDDVASPNLGDIVMMLFAPKRGPMIIDPSLLKPR